MLHDFIREKDFKYNEVQVLAYKVVCVHYNIFPASLKEKSIQKIHK